MTDLISRLAGIDPGSPEDRALAKRQAARAGAEESYRLLLHPVEPGAVSLVERHAVAAFVAHLQAEPATLAHYSGLLEATDPRLAALIVRLGPLARGIGPWGAYPPGPLSIEDEAGEVFRLPPEAREAIGTRLAAALEHAHLLVLHPRDASKDALARLLDAGWTTAGIVTLSQLVAFLAFQSRIVAGLRALQLSRAIVAA